VGFRQSLTECWDCRHASPCPLNSAVFKSEVKYILNHILVVICHFYSIRWFVFCPFFYGFAHLTDLKKSLRNLFLFSSCNSATQKSQVLTIVSYVTLSVHGFRFHVVLRKSFSNFLKIKILYYIFF
jgi:hypothetical protein